MRNPTIINPRRRTVGLSLAALMLLSVLVAVPLGVSATVSISITGGVSTKEVQAGNSVTYTLRIDNNAASSVDITMISSGVPQYWSVTYLPSSTFTVLAGSYTEITLRVSAPANATAETEATITSTATSTVNSPSVNTVTTVKQTYGLTATSPDVDKSMGPGSSAVYSVNITNSGNGIDTASLTVLNKPTGWTVSMPTQVNIQPFSTSNQAINIFNPSGTLSGQYSLTIRATSENSAYFTEIALIADITATYGISLQVTQTVKYVDPGDAVVFYFNATNTGNIQDSFDIVVASPPPGWFANANPNPISNVNPAGTSPFSLIVTAPTDADFNEQAQLDVTVRSQGNPLKLQITSIVAIVRQLHAVDLAPSLLTLLVDPDDNSQMTVSITNNGNGQDTFALSISGEPSYLTPNFNQSQVTVAKGATRDVTLTVDALDTSPAGSTKLTLRSQSTTDSSAFDFQNVTIKVTQNRDVQLQPIGATNKDGIPGQSVDFNLTLKNRGNGEDDFSLSITNLPPGWNYFFSPNPVSDLGSEESQTVVLTVDLPTTVTPGQVSLTARALSENDAGVFADLNLGVNAEQYYSVDLTSTAPFRTTQPNVSVDFPLTVRNKGSGEDTFVLSAEGANSGWVGFSTSSVNLDSDETSPVTVSVLPPKGTAVGSYPLTVRGTSSGSGTAFDSQTLTVTVSQGYGVSVVPNPPIRSVDPGTMATFQLLLKNTGNGQDEYFIQTTTNPNLWGELQLSNPYQTVNSGATLTFTFEVTIPSDASASNHTFKVKATSQGDLSKTSEATFVAAVSPIFGLQLSTVIGANNIEPSDSAVFTINVKNTGNSVDTFTIDLLGTYRTWADADSDTGPVNSGANERVDIEVTVPDGTTTGTYVVQVRVTSDGDDSLTSTVDLTITVVQKHDLTLESLSDTFQKVSPGSQISFSVKVTNTGPTADTINLAKGGNHTVWNDLSLFQVLNLGAGASQTITLTITVPANAIPETYTTAVIGTETLKGRSKTLTLTVQVRQTFDIDLSAATLDGSVLPGQTETFAFTIKNLGSGSDTFLVSATTQASWSSFNRTSIPLAVNQVGAVLLSVTPPLSPKPAVGDYPVTVKVTSVGNPTAQETITFVLTVEQVYGVKVTSDVSIAFVDPGSNATFLLTVTNKGNGPDTFVVSKDGDNPNWVKATPQVVNLAQGASTTVSVKVAVPSNAAEQDSIDDLTVTSQGSLLQESMVTLTTHVNLVFGVEVTPAAKTFTLKKDADVPYTFDITVTNRGSGPDTFSFEAIGQNDEWVSFSPAQLSLDPDESDDVEVSVDPGLSNPFDDFNGTNVWELRATSDADSFTFDGAVLTFKVDFRYGIDVTADRSEVEVGPGAQTTVNLTLSNKGNVPDNFTIVESTQPGWVSGIAAPVNIGAGSQKKVKVTIDVPEEQENGLTTLRFKVTSVGNDSKSKEVTFKVTVDEHFAVDLTAEDSSLGGGPGDTVVFTLTLENTGNVNEDLELKLNDALHDEWFLGFGEDHTSEATELNVSPADEEELTVAIELPDDIAKGSYTFELKATVTNPDATASKLLVLTVLVSYSSELFVKSSREKEKDIAPGATATYSIFLRNTGTVNETFDVFLDGSSEDFLDWVTIAVVGGGRTAPVTQVTVPADRDDITLSNEKGLTITVKVPLDAELGTVLIKIRTESQRDESSFFTFTIMVNVQEKYNVHVDVDDVEGVIKEGDPGDKVTYSFTLENAGNVQDTYTLRASGLKKSWVSFKETELTLSPKEEKLVTYTVTIPDAQTLGTHVLDIFVESQDGPASVFATYKINVTVRQVIDFTVTSDSVSEDGKPGENLTFLVDIENNGNGPDAYAFSFDVHKDYLQWVKLDAANLSIPAGRSDQLLVTVKVPRGADAAEVGIDLTVTSTVNDTGKEKIHLTATVEQLYDVSVELDTDSQPVDPARGQDGSWRVLVRNNGNARDSVRLQVGSLESGWVKTYFALPSATDLDAGAEKVLTVTLKADLLADVQGGAFDFEVSALSGDLETVSNPLVLSGRIVTADLVVSEIKVISEKPFVVGTPISIDVTIENQGQTESPQLSVQLVVGGPIQATQQLPKVLQGDTHTLSFSWTPTKPVSGTVEARFLLNGKEVRKSGERITVNAAPTSGGAIDVGSPAGMGMIGLIALLLVALIIVAMRKPKAAPSGTTVPPPGVKKRPPTGPTGPASDGDDRDEETGDGDEGEGPEDEQDHGDDEGERDDGADDEAPAPTPGKVTKIRCGRCQSIIEVTSTERPLMIRCESCNAKLRLSK